MRYGFAFHHAAFDWVGLAFGVGNELFGLRQLQFADLMCSSQLCEGFFGPFQVRR